MPEDVENVDGVVVSLENEDEQVAVNMDYWQERLYRGTDLYDTDAKFFENAQKGTFLEGKMGAREMTFAKGGGLPTIMPLPAGQQGGTGAGT